MQISFEDPETNKAGGMHKGIIICGGGYKYCTNAWVCIKMLRMLGNALPVELWLWENEYFTELETWLAPFNARIRLAEVPKIKTDLLPVGTRWQWELKPLALLKTGFREVLLLDADSFPVADPAFLFDIPQYQATGALFWPDTGRMERCDRKKPSADFDEVSGDRSILVG
jgi:alpha 1,2-mannosyltransferase